MVYCSCEPGTAPITKNGVRRSPYEGVAPITKNVRVVDEFGNTYDSTYPKRAKGLIKHGRARFVDEHTICLISPRTCPPDISEDTEMTYTENIGNDTVQELAETALPTETEMDCGTGMPEIPEKITMQYIFRCIRAVQEDKIFLYRAIEKLGNVRSEGPGDVGAAAKANALSHAVEEHEKTNRRLIDFYERIYDDLYKEHMDSTLDTQQKAMQILANAHMDCATLDSLSGIFDTIRHING